MSPHQPFETHFVGGEGLPLPLSGRWETGPDPALTWCLKDDHTGTPEGSHKPTTHTRGVWPSQGEETDLRKPHPSGPGTQGLPGLTLGQVQRAPLSSWLQPGQHSCLSSISLQQGKADRCRGHFCVIGMQGQLKNVGQSKNTVSTAPVLSIRC